MIPTSVAPPRRSVASRLRAPLLGALLAGMLVGGAGPALPIAAQEAQPGSGGGQLPSRPDDFDIDGLLNDDEARYGTDPNNADTDGDGTSDGAEINYGTDPLVPAPLRYDDDLDGLTNDEELALGTDPAKLDSDGDGTYDGVEVENGMNPLVPDEYQPGPAVDYDRDDDGIPDDDEIWIWTTDPDDYDSDGDRIGDGWEAYYYLTDPTWDDTDREGLSDSDEIFTYGTDPLKEDTDGDGYPDGQEVSGPCPGNPLDPNKGPRFSC